MKVVARWIGCTTAFVTGSTVPSACAARLRFDHVGVFMPFLRAKPRQRAAAQHARPHGWTEAGHVPSGRDSEAAPHRAPRTRFRSAGECRAQALRVPRPPFVPPLFVPRFVPVLAAVLA